MACQGALRYETMKLGEDLLENRGVSRALCCAQSLVMTDSLEPHSLWPARLPCPWAFSRQEYWSGLPCPSPGELPNPGKEPGSPALQANSLSAELQGEKIYIFAIIQSKVKSRLLFENSGCVCMLRVGQGSTGREI